jgi:hypothetical protein
MPEWLQQPPAWKRPASAEEEPRSLPPPDTSPIDPRTMLALEDLPEWLQAIAARSNASSSPVIVGVGSDLRGDDDGSPLVSEPEVAIGTSPVESVVPPPLVANTATHTEPDHDRAWWMSDRVMGALLVAVVLTLIYVILVASDIL